MPGPQGGEFSSISARLPGALLAHNRARTRDPLHTSTTVTHETSLPIAPQKPLPLQSKGNYYFKVSEQVTSPIETLLTRTTANELAVSHPLHSPPF